MKTSQALVAGIAVCAGIVALKLLPLRADESKSGKAPKKTAMEVSPVAPEDPKEPVVKSDEEWKKILTPEQYRILRQAGTEARDGQVYEEFKKQGEGTYHCAGCGAELFSSKEKFDSHCGWPSFYDPSKVKNVKYNVDYVLGYPRTEVRCKVCDGHLGHVFDGEGFATPTDKRYCINGTVLKFVPRASGGESAESAKPKAGDAKESESAADPAKAEKKPG